MVIEIVEAEIAVAEVEAIEIGALLLDQVYVRLHPTVAIPPLRASKIDGWMVKPTPVLTWARQAARSIFSSSGWKGKGSSEQGALTDGAGPDPRVADSLLDLFHHQLRHLVGIHLPHPLRMHRLLVEPGGGDDVHPGRLGDTA